MVQRYDLVGDMDGNCNLNEARMEKSDDGIYVYYRDYKELDNSFQDYIHGNRRACGETGRSKRRVTEIQRPVP